jgi:CRP-like cAMP-binding protein
MPKAVSFKANTVVFFQGDVSEKIYILKSGKVLLKSNDIETGEEIKEVIMTGEFFGVKSALGKFPRDETALVMQNSDILVFSLVEFEQLVLKNTRIIMKMLRVFSNQLRRIHHQVKNTISQGKVLPPEEGLFKIGEYYFKNGLFSQALYTYQRYITYYPSGDFATEANGRIPNVKGSYPLVPSGPLQSA